MSSDRHVTPRPRAEGLSPASAGRHRRQKYGGIEDGGLPVNHSVLLCGAAYLKGYSDGAPFQNPLVSER
jgi:hypothetical protein